MQCNTPPPPPPHAQCLFPTKPLPNPGEGDNQPFVAKFDSTGALIYATFVNNTGTAFLGGGSATALAVDSAGNAYVTGLASLGVANSDFPTTPGAFQTAFAGGPAMLS